MDSPDSGSEPDWMDRLKGDFPALSASGFRVTSGRTTDYNCIAWAGGDTEVWWWPGSAYSWWPHGVSTETTIPAFEAAYAHLGYVSCPSAESEDGFEKIALYATNEGVQHAARSLSCGRWTSKLGELEDIEHALGDVEGPCYGQAVAFLKRPRP